MDIASTFNPTTLTADYRVSGGALASDADLQTAVIISLFTDRRAQDDDALPDASASKRGWWGDALSSAGRIGSRLWLLGREKQTERTVNRAREYAQEALAWLVEAGVASSIDVQAQTVRMGVLGLFVQINRPQGQPSERLRFDVLWEQLRK